MDYFSLLKDIHLKITPQRASVLKVLCKHGHPTIEELYQDIKQEFPSISLATIYKNINVLRKSGAITEIVTCDGKVRYDIYMKPHTHIVCKNCGHIEDICFSDLVYKYKEELAETSRRNIQKIDITVSVESCASCE